jgi:death-on-curing protein
VAIIFLTLDEVIEIHHDQIRRYGGDATLRDLGLLQSAVATPQSGFGGQYLHAYPHEMAAAYLFHLAQNHPFVDGNKRTALAAALTFLEMNGLKLSATKDEVEQLTLSVAAGQTAKATVADFFRTRVGA